FSKSGETNNPAVRVEVYEGEKLVFIPWLFFNYPGLVQAIPNSGYDLVLTGFRTIPYSGISIGKDPGTNVVWAGTIVMGLGFILAFFVYHRRIWVAVYPVSGEDGSMTGGSLVKIGGMINKNPLGFEREFKDIIEALGGRSR
ncbi:MAG: cytochrome c biogenesis protein ResB, partial [Deltaproteobacteria bacterium]|nr:cytochrome c biogenesis protein ResB [Deltaproteobacteria bacterium]